MDKAVTRIVEIHKKLLADFENRHLDTVISAAKMLIECFAGGGCVYLCGNGGSAADAQHIAGEFVGRFRKERHPLPAVALSTDTSVITCIGNDYGYDDVFARQVEALAGPSDILWAFSTSGTSKNVVAAAKAAKDKSSKILAFTGKSDTPLESMADLCLAIDAPNTASAQEIHVLAYHIICELIDKRMFGDKART